MNDAGSTPGLPTAELRPGVFRPDWSVVKLDAARRTLQRRLGAHPAGVARWAGLEPQDDLAWRTVLGLFVEQGRAPQAHDVARVTTRTLEQALSSLRLLRARDLVVLDGSDTSVLAAYPFTSRETGHQVTINGRALHALCAIDALGAGAMSGADTTIASACPCCGEPIRVETRGNGRELRSVAPAAAVVWYTLVFDGCAAQSCCPSTLFFRDDAHLQRWLEAGRLRQRGDRLGMAEALEIGIALFAPLLARAA